MAPPRLVVPKPKNLSLAAKTLLGNDGARGLRDLPDSEKTLTPDELTYLATSSRANWWVASHPDTPKDVLRALAFSSARNSVFAREDVSFEDIRDAVMIEKDTHCWKTIGERSDFPIELAREFLEEPTVSNRIKCEILSGCSARLSREDALPFAVSSVKTEISRRALQVEALTTEDLSSIAEKALKEPRGARYHLQELAKHANASAEMLDDLVALAEAANTSEFWMSEIVRRAAGNKNVSAERVRSIADGRFAREAAREIIASPHFTDDEVIALSRRKRLLSYLAQSERFADEWCVDNLLPLLESGSSLGDVEKRDLSHGFAMRMGRKIGVYSPNRAVLVFNQMTIDRLRGLASMSMDDPFIKAAYDRSVRESPMA